MDQANIYRIKVRGIIPGSWIDRMGGMRIIATADGSTLEGPLPDQAALVGVLNTLYALRLPIIEVASASG